MGDAESTGGTDYIAMAERALEWGDTKALASTYAQLATAIELRRIADLLTIAATRDP